MSVGIMDADLSKYILVPFNLEVMKLSAFYKRQKEIVVFAPEFTPGKNTKFIYRKDYDDGDFPFELTSHKNVEFGGLAFTNNKYKPLPLEVEKMRPDPTIYEKMEWKIKADDTQIRHKIYQNMMEAEHIRLSLDGETIWPDFPSQFTHLKTARNIIFHDYDLGQVKDSFRMVQRVLARARTDGWATRVGMKFPVQISDGQSLLNWSSIRSNSVFYSLQYNGVIEDEPFCEWVGNVREKAIYTQMDYNITRGPYSEDYLVHTLLPKLYRQVVISRSYHIKYLLKYDEGYFHDPMWERVIRLINCYHTSFFGQPLMDFLSIIDEDTMYDFASHTLNEPPRYCEFTRQDVRDIFHFVRENNPELFSDFYNCNAKKLGGRL